MPTNFLHHWRKFTDVHLDFPQVSGRRTVEFGDFAVAFLGFPVYKQEEGSEKISVCQPHIWISCILQEDSLATKIADIIDLLISQQCAGQESSSWSLQTACAFDYPAMAERMKALHEMEIRNCFDFPQNREKELKNCSSLRYPMSAYCFDFPPLQEEHASL